MIGSLTLSDKEQQHRLKMIQRMLDNYEFFVKTFWDVVQGSQPLGWNWHMSVICEELQVVAERAFIGEPSPYNLIINCPPGSSKSTLATILFPAWCWAKYPQTRCITASHTAELVLDLASKARDVIRSEKFQFYFPGIEIREDTEAKGLYRNNFGGDRISCTVAGKSPTGQHAHLLIVDDPIDPKKAISAAELKIASDFMTITLPSRRLRNNKGFIGIIILVMQRLHRGDPSAVMLEEAKKEGAKPVRHICLPAELTDKVSPTNLRSFYINKLLDPQRLNEKELKAEQVKRMAYASQYLQDPTQAEGAMFRQEWFKQTCRAAPIDCFRVRSWDRAATADGGCYTSGTLMAIDKEGRIYVEHNVHGQWATDERNRKMKETAARDRAKYGKWEPKIVVEREGGSSGRDAYLMLCRVLDGYPVIEDLPTGSKDVRAEPWATQLSAMNVWFVDDGTWDFAGYVEEHLAFAPEGTGKRLGKWKDQVDSSSQAHKYISQRRKPGSLRVYNMSRKKDKGVQLLAWDRDFPLVLDFPHWMIEVYDPWEDMTEPDTNPNRMRKMVLKVCDMEPKDWQDKWEIPAEEFGNRVPKDIVFTREEAKRLWSFLLKPGEKPPDVVCVRDSGGRRAASICKVMSDILRIKWEPDEEITMNSHIMDTIKIARGLVVS